MADKLSSTFAEVDASAQASVSSGLHITYLGIVKGCNYGCLRQKTLVEDAHPVPSRPCMVVWDGLAKLARYKLTDAVFCHVYYDPVAVSRWLLSPVLSVLRKTGLTSGRMSPAARLATSLLL